ncbi:uncharacterized protein M421DRAFT_416054 [Didymella exigua CBS 183.55]|uniref:Protein kinase domain-containing protein n=1 Tax=Didymella exigua CBS 183.55 TaxID=1150837 RepID=A0A6A5S5E1_9PLEO|nr:uncharacterized protein M421DRAFT_416054 [Didymella exigua CBS 183.55]KAF1933706.1 hypothetical protein M421DRAFT_416054 [Didymella exigua CBS 183.55]
MGRPFRISAPTRSLYHLRYRLALVLSIFILFEQYHLLFVYRHALAAKYSPTEFKLHAEHSQPWTLDEESAHLQDRIVANRATWRVLGKGWEGETFVYQDSVIKTFRPGQSPFRNCAPGTAGEKWPTEIPASLYFGGTENNATTSQDGFLPVKAFFMVDSSDTQAEWHLVTTLLRHGSLKTLVANMREKGMPYEDIDAHYRPAFEGLLASLHKLHEAGFCHDDVKPANIFVADDTHWILGDLGNLRHVSHPYHASLLWSENAQLPDCRANDNIRALKSYIRFVRDSALDADAFNAQFFEKRGPLSRFFWSTVANSSHLSAADSRARSAALHPQLEAKTSFECVEQASGPAYAWLSIFSRRWRYHYAVNELLHTRMGEKMARWWAMTWLLGVPVWEVCGV